jgi:hypothetical protein
MTTKIVGLKPTEIEIAKTIRTHINVEKYREVNTQLPTAGYGNVLITEFNLIRKEVRLSL